MTKIDLSKFLQNNFDEFVHLRALKNVIDQVDSINAQQDTNITHAQSTADKAQQTADTAQQTATTAKNTADQAESDAKKAQADADTKSTINYQKADGTTVYAPTLLIADVKREDIDNGRTSVGKGLMCLDSQNKPIEMGLSNQLISIQGALKMFILRDEYTAIKFNSTIQGISDSRVQFVFDPVLLANGTLDHLIKDVNIFGKMNIDDLINAHAFTIPLAESLDDQIVGDSCMANLHIIGKNLITLPVTLNFDSATISVELNENYTTNVLTGAGLSTGTTYPIQIN